MSFINIHTNNLSRQLNNSTTFADNWVYVPGTSITGDYSKPYAFKSLEEFRNTCGAYGPEGSITYEYVAGLLSAGLPVLFRRIARQDQDTVSEKDYDTVPEGEEPRVRAMRANYPFTSKDETTGKTLVDLLVEEKFGGTYGNDMSFVYNPTEKAHWFEVYHNGVLLEKHKLITITPADDTTEKINNKLINAINSFESDRVKLTLGEHVKAETLTLPATSERLTGGTDFPETLVNAEIVKTYNFISDKILYQPKFLTAGGHFDDPSVEATPIADKMKEISSARQDCRALIDLPIGTLSGDQQNAALKLAYQQTSDTAPIPSASICAPWCYMQVGGSQLWMPPSFAYLTVVGNALSKGGEVYTPKAGLTSGVIPNVLKTEFEIGASLSETWQDETKVNINPIMKLQGGNYVIAGNSTLLLPEVSGNELNAFAESSADLTVIEIRRFVYNLATELQYQYNSTEAFETFSIRTAKFLEKMISEGAMSNYSIANASTEDDPRTLKIKLDVYLTPTIKKIEIFLNVAYGSVNISTGGEA